MGAAACLLGMGVGGAAGPVAPPPPQPDLDITYIGLAPRYPAFDVEYPDGMPQAVDPDSGRPLSAEEAQKVQRWPRSGEVVTATARVVNHGGAPTGPFKYTWSLNGKKLPEARHPGLAADASALGPAGIWHLAGAAPREAALRPGSFVDLAVPVAWRRNRTVRLEVRLEDGARQEVPHLIPEGEPPARRDNNVREERLDGLAWLVLTTRSAYNDWARVRGPWLSWSFEDWAQHQLDLLRGRFQASVYPEAPRGVEQPLRLDMVRVLEDGEDLAAVAAVAARNGWDGVWIYGPQRRVSRDAAASADDLDPALFDAALASLGIADLRSLLVLPEQNRARLQDSDGLAPGYQPGPLPTAGLEGLPEHTVLALNHLLGRRRGHRGSYLFDVPRQLRLRVVDSNGRPVPDAELAVWQKGADGVPAAPLASGRTSAAGDWPLPRRRTASLATADGFSLHDNPFGALQATGANGLLLVEVRARGFTEHQWLSVTALNLAAWREVAREVTVDLRTRIPAVQAPAAVSTLTARRTREGGVDGVELRWEPPPGPPPAAYSLYRARYPTYQLEPLTAFTFRHARHFDPLQGSHPVRYAVSALDLDGFESRLRTAVSH